MVLRTALTGQSPSHWEELLLASPDSEEWGMGQSGQWRARNAPKRYQKVLEANMLTQHKINTSNVHVVGQSVHHIEMQQRQNKVRIKNFPSATSEVMNLWWSRIWRQPSQWKGCRGQALSMLSNCDGLNGFFDVLWINHVWSFLGSNGLNVNQRVFQSVGDVLLYIVCILWYHVQVLEYAKKDKYNQM